MNTRDENFRKAVVHLSGGVEGMLSTATPPFREWLTERCIAKPVADFLCANCLTKSIPLADGCGSIMTPEDIMKTNSEWPNMLADGFIQIGSAMNGDPIVIDLAEGDGRVGFLSHDELWEPNPPMPREAFAPAASCIGDFFYGMVFDDSFPVDFYDAVEMETLYEAPEA
jgi:hypothetical protein